MTGREQAGMMRSMLAERKLVSEAEFLGLPESMNKVELLDGEVIVSPAPSYWHQELLGRVVYALRSWAKEQATPVTVLQSPVDIRFGPNRILQPDAAVVLGAVARDHRGPIDRVPDVCVEVLSADRVYDRVTKRLIYADAGVREYWVVEPAGLIERWTGPGLAQVEEVRGALSTPLSPRLSLDVVALFTDTAP
jgi:Uma2 family endonuclease